MIHRERMEGSGSASLETRANRRRVNIFAILLTVSLLLSLSGIVPSGICSYGASRSDMTYVSVGLKYGSSAVSECRLQSADGFQVVDVSDGLEETLPLYGYDTLVVTADRGLLTVTDEDGVVLATDLGEDSCIMNGDYLGEGNFTYGGKKYRGGMKFKLRSDGSMNVINYLSLDHYLYGVLQGEMGHLNPLEALKAQAVAARSYAIANISAHRSEGFELCTNSHCQMYYGVSVEYPETIRAVDETSELVLWYDGKVVPGYYHKNSGGHTQNSEDVWSGKEGYLRAVEDTYCPDYPWSASFTWSQLAGKVTGIGTISDVYISKRNDNGNVLELTFKGSGGTKTLSKENIRMTLGSSVVKSLNFTVDGGSGDNESGASGQLSLAIRGSDGTTVSKSSAVLQGSAGQRTVSSVSGLVVQGADETRTLTGGQGNSSGGTVASGEGITLRGLGYGHSVGMCQDSAILMAKDGMDFEEILNFFYTDIDIDNVDR